MGSSLCKKSATRRPPGLEGQHETDAHISGEQSWNEVVQWELIKLLDVCQFSVIVLFSVYFIEYALDGLKFTLYLHHTPPQNKYLLKVFSMPSTGIVLGSMSPSKPWKLCHKVVTLILCCVLHRRKLRNREMKLARKRTFEIHTEKQGSRSHNNS